MSLLQTITRRVAGLEPEAPYLTLASAGLDLKTFPSGTTVGDAATLGAYDRRGWITTNFVEFLDTAAALIGPEAIDATMSSVFMSCLSSVVKNFVQGEFVAVERKADGSEVPLPDHPLSWMLRHPSQDLDPEVVWGLVLEDRYSGDAGTGYTMIMRDGGARPNGLFPVPAELLRPRWPRDGSAWISHYEYRPFGWGGPVSRLELGDVVAYRDGWARGAASQGRLGRPATHSVDPEILSDQRAAHYTATLLGNFGGTRTVMTLREDKGKETLVPTPAEGRSMVDAFQAMTRGRNLGRPVYVPAAIRLDQIGFNPEELTLDAVRKTAEERVASAFNLPLLVAGFGMRDASTYSNLATAYRQGWLTCIIPLGLAIARALERVLLRQFSDGARLRIRYDTSRVWAMQTDRAEVEKRAREHFLAAGLTYADYRRALGFEPTPADEWIVLPNSVAGVVRAGEDPATAFALTRGAPPAIDGDGGVDGAKAIGMIFIEREAKAARQNLSLAAAKADTVPEPDDAPNPTMDDLDGARERLEEMGLPLADRLAPEPERGEAVDEAKAFEPEPPLGVYRDARGVEVVIATLRAELVAYRDRAASHMQDLAARVGADEISLAEYELGLRDLVRDAHLTALATAKEGWENVTRRDLGRLGATLRKEYGFLRRRVLKLENGEISAAQLAATVAQYSNAARATFEDEWGSIQDRRGARSERLVKGGTETSCDGTNSCDADQDRGWVPRGTLGRVGSRACKGACGCHFEYSTAAIEEARA